MSESSPIVSPAKSPEMGPEAVESSDLGAYRRFFSEFWPIALLCLILLILAYFIGQGARRAPDQT